MSDIKMPDVIYVTEPVKTGNITVKGYWSNHSGISKYIYTRTDTIRDPEVLVKALNEIGNMPEGFSVNDAKAVARAVLQDWGQKC